MHNLTIRRVATSVILPRRGALPTPSAQHHQSPLLFEARRTWLRDEGVQTEADRHGPKRVMSVQRDGKFFDPNFYHPDKIEEEFKNANTQADAEATKWNESYRGGDAPPHQQQQHQQQQPFQHRGAGGGTTSTDGASADEEDPQENPYANPNKSERATSAEHAFMTGGLNDRARMTVRGQAVPEDLPLTDAEVDAHPAAIKMRKVGMIGSILVLYVMWKVMTDPFNEGERFSRYRVHGDGTDRESAMPWMNQQAIGEQKLKERERMHGVNRIY